MKKKFTEAQIVFALRQAESGTPIQIIANRMSEKWGASHKSPPKIKKGGLPFRGHPPFAFE